jgi:hypothetical protein
MDLATVLVLSLVAVGVWAGVNLVLIFAGGTMECIYGLVGMCYEAHSTDD